MMNKFKLTPVVVVLKNASWLAVLFLLGACAQVPNLDPAAKERLAAVERAEALFKEKCRTVAGEKIYKTVPDVEGLLLMKLRPERGGLKETDRFWPEAAFAKEAWGDSYIHTFLGYEYSASPTGEPVTTAYRGYINVDRRPGGLPGYRWVEAIEEKDGQRYRYTGRWDEPWKTDSSYSKSYVRFTLDKTPSTHPMPRYGVTWEDHVIPEEREIGLASTTIKVIDLKTNEVLGELLRYAWMPTYPSRTTPVNWLHASKCPGNPVGSNAATRKFVDQILIPRKED